MFLTSLHMKQGRVQCYNMTKGRSHFLNAYHVIDAVLGALCVFPTLFFPIALQELVLLLSSPFYK